MTEKEKQVLNVIMSTKVFGDLKVKEYQEQGYWTTKGKGIYKWFPAVLCDCKACGKQDVKVKPIELINGRKTDCGCKSKITLGRGMSFEEKRDLILKTKFGRLTPYEHVRYEDRTSANGRDCFKCKCDCGNETESRMHNLLKGASTSCGCGSGKSRTMASKIKNIQYVGTTVGDWEVLDLTSDGREQFFTCRCKCGGIRSVNVHNIISGKSKDCGCGRKETLSNIMSVIETGNKIGMVTVGPICGKSRFNKTLYTCDCDCGRTNVVLDVSSLKNQSNPSCGCVSRTKGEKAVFDFLLKNDIDFELEATFDDLRYNGVILRFDFYVPSRNLVIEYDGLFHFEDKPKCMDSVEVNYTRVRDEVKNKYCEEKHIDMIRIPYFEFDRIEEILANKLGI